MNNTPDDDVIEWMGVIAILFAMTFLNTWIVEYRIADDIAPNWIPDILFLFVPASVCVGLYILAADIQEDRHVLWTFAYLLALVLIGVVLHMGFQFAAGKELDLIGRQVSRGPGRHYGSATIGQGGGGAVLLLCLNLAQMGVTAVVGFILYSLSRRIWNL